MNHRSTILLLACLVVLAALSALRFSDSPALKSIAESVGLAPAKQTAVGKSKPVCSQVIVPAGDCIPQHLANLPPDPGKAALTEFIDTNKDGVRDEVEIWIEHTFGSSRRAVAAARQVAMAAQLTVAAGAIGISHADAKALATDKTMKAVDCFMMTVEPPLNSPKNLQGILLAVADTDERFTARRRFEVAASGHVYELKIDTPPVEVCGYDPAALPN